MIANVKIIWRVFHFQPYFHFPLKTGILSALMISSDSSFQIDVQLGKNDFLYNSIHAFKRNEVTNTRNSLIHNLHLFYEACNLSNIEVKVYYKF